MTSKNAIKWTEQQKRAISDRGRAVLVSASAGTGKTAVLSGRCVDIVSDRDICQDVRSMLVLTFTNAAADEMRLRIAEALKAKLAKSGQAHLGRQLLLLDGADISTIHSFCKRLITEHFYKLGIDPGFKVIDADEQRLLKSEVLEETIRQGWEEENLRQGLEQLLWLRNVQSRRSSFLERIIELNDFLDGVIRREDWHQRTMLLAEATNPFTTDLGKKQKDMLLEKLQQCQGQLEYASKLCEKENPSNNEVQKLETTFLEPVNQCIRYLQAGKLSGCVEILSNFEKPRFIYKPKDIREPIGDIIENVTKSAVKTFESLGGLAIVNPDYLNIVARGAGLQTKVIVELTKIFKRLYTEAKRQLGCLDFADLEHYALKLLRDSERSGDEMSPSVTALGLRNKYKYVFVDEYQDINSVQQAILDLLSGGDNIFVVGDIKQSIYQWRGARPEIFLQRLQTASAEAAESGERLRVDLKANFRSRKGILDFTNRLFGRIMKTPFASIDYDQSAILEPAADYEPQKVKGPIVEMHLLDEEPIKAEFADNEQLNLVSSSQRQGALIAKRIKQMVGAQTGQTEFSVFDKQAGSYRAVQYRDIVILMRSLAHKVNEYAEVLSLAGIPVHSQSSVGYFATTEITDCLCLLKVLDNPQRDIELAAVLRSPLFKTSDTELAKVRAYGRSKSQDEQKISFFDCARLYAASGPDEDLRQKLSGTFAQIELWRTMARRGSLADLIWHIYRQSGYLSFVSAQPNGKGRRANLLKLHNRAIQFEGFASSSRAATLGRFVEFIEKLIAQEQDWGPADVIGPAENAVRIMSIHKSKGLEFGVVFLAELDSEFNKKSFQGDCLFDEQDTLGLQIIERASRTKLRSLGHQVISENISSASLAEEMRTLYVGITRSRERLILTGAVKKRHCRDILYCGALANKEPIADWQLRRCKSPLGWILYGLSDQKSLHEAFETGYTEGLVDDDLFYLKLYGQDRLSKLSEEVSGLKHSKFSRAKSRAGEKLAKQTELSLISKIKDSLGWKYEFGDASELPGKTSVTKLTHQSDEFAVIDYSESLQRQPNALVPENIVLTARGSTVVGTATHLVISQLDLSGVINAEAIAKTINNLSAKGAIAETAAEQIDIGSIITFFESELGQVVLEPANRIWREWPFTFTIPASEIAKENEGPASNEAVIVQGVIDIVAQTPRGLFVIDLKTDRINAEQTGERAESYKRQMNLYGQAAQAILKSSSVSKWLYFLSPGCAVKIQ